MSDPVDLGDIPRFLSLLLCMACLQETLETVKWKPRGLKLCHPVREGLNNHGCGI
jgi:hypothetical protein